MGCWLRLLAGCRFLLGPGVSFTKTVFFIPFFVGLVNVAQLLATIADVLLFEYERRTVLL